MAVWQIIAEAKARGMSGHTPIAALERLLTSVGHTPHECLPARTLTELVIRSRQAEQWLSRQRELDGGSL